MFVKAPVPSADNGSTGEFGQQCGFLGAVVHRLLDERQLSLAALARRIGYNKGHLSRVLHGPTDRPPTAKLVEALAAELGHHEQLRSAAERDRPQLTTEPVLPAEHRPAQVPASAMGLVGDPLAGLDRHTVAITGPPGSGKTAWARWWTHRIAEQYPDGHLRGDLREHTPSQLLAAWLGALGLEPDRLPKTYADRVRLWQALSRTRRLVVLIEEVTNSEQVLDLRPAGERSAVIVTTRTRLTGVLGKTGAAQITLGPLDERAAVRLLRGLLEPHPVAADEELLGEIAAVCEQLPLALHQAADRLATSADPRALLADLRQDALAILHSRDGDALRSRLNDHLDVLPAGQARVARLLAHHDHPATAAEIAALRRTTEPDARRLADELVAWHVLAPTSDGRYRMSGLLARAMRERPGPESEIADAQRRWCAWWLTHARRAAELLDAEGEQNWNSWHPPDGLATVDITTPGEARAWCAQHVDELPTAITRAAELGLDAPAWWYLQALRPYLTRNPHPDLAQRSVSAARRALRKQTDQRLDQFSRDLLAGGG